MLKAKRVASEFSLLVYGAILLSVGVAVVDIKKEILRFKVAETRLSQMELLKIWNSVQKFELKPQRTNRFL